MTATAKNTMGGDRPRNAEDLYATPQPLADAITSKLRETIGTPDIIIEPSAGTGAFVRAARATWPGVRIDAIEPHQEPGVLLAAGASSAVRATWEEGIRAPAVPWSSGRVLILGNPPYNLPGDGRGKDAAGLSKPTTAERHVALALDRLGHDEAPRGWGAEPQPRYLAFLLRQSFAATPARFVRLFAKGGLRYRWTVVGRPSYTEDGKTDGAEYEVFVWQAGHMGAPEGGWIEWRGSTEAA
jgi:hypothetical protein